MAKQQAHSYAHRSYGWVSCQSFQIRCMWSKAQNVAWNVSAVGVVHNLLQYFWAVTRSAKWKAVARQPESESEIQAETPRQKGVAFEVCRWQDLFEDLRSVGVSRAYKPPSTWQVVKSAMAYQSTLMLLHELTTEPDMAQHETAWRRKDPRHYHWAENRHAFSPHGISASPCMRKVEDTWRIHCRGLLKKGNLDGIREGDTL
eukprot:111758-Chlamydomonas_euryale.AAC.3